MTNKDRPFKYLIETTDGASYVHESDTSFDTEAQAMTFAHMRIGLRPYNSYKLTILKHGDPIRTKNIKRR